MRRLRSENVVLVRVDDDVYIDNSLVEAIEVFDNEDDRGGVVVEDFFEEDLVFVTFYIGEVGYSSRVLNRSLVNDFVMWVMGRQENTYYFDKQFLI